jgi:hypothetical protein
MTLNAGCAQAQGALGGQADYLGVYPPQAEAALFSRLDTSQSIQQEAQDVPEVERITLIDGVLLLNHATMERKQGREDKKHLLPLCVIRERTRLK